METIIIDNHKVSHNTLPQGIKYEDHTLSVDSKKVFKDPIKVVLKDDNNDRLHIIVGNSTEIKLILEIQSQDLDKNTFDLKLSTGVNSQVKYLLVADLKSKDALLNHTFNVERDSNLELLGGFVSDVLTSKMLVNLVGENANVNVKAVAVSSDAHNQNVDVLITHKAPNSFGDMTNIGIATKQGKVKLNGVEKIEKGMKNANAFQTLKGIITSDDAVVEVNPILLIDEYDVKAGHGATIGKIEEEVLFYLRSRGLTKEAAERLVIFGFLQPIIDEITDEPLKERFESLVNERIWLMLIK